jgi:hypothetical protein
LLSGKQDDDENVEGSFFGEMRVCGDMASLMRGSGGGGGSKSYRCIKQAY